MSSLTAHPKIFGFCSYSDGDDKSQRGTLSKLSATIQRELQAQLGRSEETLKLWHRAASPEKTEALIRDSVFFIPIITSGAINSQVCQMEFWMFKRRELELGRTDLIFPMFCVDISQSHDNTWVSFVSERPASRLLDLNSPDVSLEIELLCERIVRSLTGSNDEKWLSRGVSPERAARLRATVAPGSPSKAHDADKMVIEIQKAVKFDADSGATDEQAKAQTLRRRQEPRRRVLASSVDEPLPSMSRSDPLESRDVGETRLKRLNEAMLRRQDAARDKEQDAIEFGISHPTEIRRGVSFLVDAWIFRQQDRGEASRRAMQLVSKGGDFRSGGAATVALGSRLTAKVRIASWEVKPRSQTISWNGTITNVSFEVSPKDYPSSDPVIGTCTFHQGALRIGEVKFELSIGKDIVAEGRLTTGTPIRSAFASYASKDRLSVLPRVHGIEKAHVRVFLDVHNLRSNDLYQTELFEQIDAADVLYLFWSRHAKESKWVDREWRYGMTKKGIDFIDPVPLVDPRKVPPPRELSEHKHFDDWVLKYIETEKRANIWRRLGTWMAGAG